VRGQSFWLLRREAGGHEITANTLRAYSLSLRKIKEAFRDKRLSELRLHLENWLLRAEGADSSKIVSLGVLRILFKEAIREELIKEDPTKQIKPLKVRGIVRGVFAARRRPTQSRGRAAERVTGANRFGSPVQSGLWMQGTPCPNCQIRVCRCCCSRA
jgi:hypothetical protein